MYIVINSWFGLYTALSIKFHAHYTEQPSPSPPKFVLTMNCKIFEKFQKMASYLCGDEKVLSKYAVFEKIGS